MKTAFRDVNSSGFWSPAAFYPTSPTSPSGLADSSVPFSNTDLWPTSDCFGVICLSLLSLLHVQYASCQIWCQRTFSLWPITIHFLLVAYSNRSVYKEVHILCPGATHHLTVLVIEYIKENCVSLWGIWRFKVTFLHSYLRIKQF